MIDKKILLSTILLAFFAGCDAGEKIQEVVDDVKEDYFEEKVADVVDNTDTVLVRNNITLDEEVQAMLDIHNEARKVAPMSDLIWSDRIALDAQSYADTLAKSGAFVHDPKNHNGYIITNVKNGHVAGTIMAESPKGSSKHDEYMIEELRNEYGSTKDYKKE